MKHAQFSICFGLMLILGSSMTIFSQTVPVVERYVEVQDITGEVKVKAKPEESWKLATKGMHLTEKGEIKTGSESTAVILLDEKGATGKVDVKPNSWMRIAELSYDSKRETKKTLLDLALGQVLVQAEKLKGESSFQVRTPTSTTSVRGTVFEVKVAEE